MKGSQLLSTFLLILILNSGLSKYTQLPECLLEGDEKFPDSFVIGAASSAYQIEGAWNKDGKGESIWDVGTHQHSDWIPDGSNGDIAADSYHNYLEDVIALKESEVRAYKK